MSAVAVTIAMQLVYFFLSEIGVESQWKWAFSDSVATAMNYVACLLRFGESAKGKRSSPERKGKLNRHIFISMRNNNWSRFSAE